MKIAVISDIHDNLSNLQKCLLWCRQNTINTIICCGDVTTQKSIEFFLNNFKGEIHLVRGNIDTYRDIDMEQFKNLRYYGSIGYFQLDNRKIGLCHEPFLINDVLEKGHCDVIFYGHTHKHLIKRTKDSLLVNPGTLGDSYRQEYTFIVWNTENDEMELKDVGGL